jgi:hypothetical protein
MGNDESALTRRDWLVTGGVALSGLALTAASGGAETAMRQVRARLSLNGAHGQITAFPHAVATCCKLFAQLSIADSLPLSQRPHHDFSCTLHYNLNLRRPVNRPRQILA